MRCRHCEGSLVQSTADFEAKWKGHSIVFKDLPVLKCERCGYMLFEPETVNLVGGFLRARSAEGAPLPDVLTVEEAADYLRVSTQTIYSLQKAGELPGTKVGGQLRFLREELRKLCAPEGARRVPAAAAFRGKPTEEDLHTLAELLSEDDKQNPKQ